MNILCLIDGSASSFQCALFLKSLPVKARKHIELLHIFTPIEQSWAVLPEEQAERIASYNGQAKEKAYQMLERVKKELVKKGLSCSSRLEEGAVKDVLSEEFKKGTWGLIAAGSRGLGSLKRLFLGSTCEFLLKKASCSVLVYKLQEQELSTEEHQSGKPFRLLCAYDHQDASKKVIERLEAMDQLAIEKITLATASETVYHYGIGDHTDLSSIWESYGKIALSALQTAAADLEKKIDRKVDAAYLSAALDGSDSLCHYAHQHRMDLILMGCSDKSAIERFAIGSFSLKTVRHATCPVWIEK